VITVAVDAGRGEDRGQAVQELESGETERGAASGVGLGEEVEDLVGTAANQVEAVEGERTPGTVAKEPLEAGPVGGFDADAPVQTEPAAVLPSEHVLSVVGFQETVAGKVAEHSLADRVLETLKEFVGKGCGFVKPEGLGLERWILPRLTLELLEEPVQDAQVVVEVRVQRRAETMEEAHRPKGG
jgi:hypothetical protein